MNDFEHRVTAEFLSNLDALVVNFIDAFELKHEQKIGNLKDPLLRWLDFRLRYVDPRPRRVVLSNKFPKELSEQVNTAFLQMIGRVEKGEDINPYQGKGLIHHHDVSGAKRQNRTDFLWADWGIIHFHLTDTQIPVEGYFSRRSDWLLFGIPGDDFLAVIDIRQHDEEGVFANPELVEVLVETWPQMMERFEVKGLAPPGEADILGSNEYERLRRSGVSAFVTIKGRQYMAPGMGLTTASTPLRVTLAMDKAREYVKALAVTMCTYYCELPAKTQEPVTGMPSLRLCITPVGMAVHEAISNNAWLLPRTDCTAEATYLADLNELIAPEWATKRAFLGHENLELL